MADLSGFPSAELQYDGAGNVSGTDHDLVALAADPSVTDLVVMAHGWNEDAAEARQLYANLAVSLRAVLDGGAVPQLAGRTIAIAGLIWPAKQFADALSLTGDVTGEGVTVAAGVSERDLIGQIDALRPAFPEQSAQKVLDEAAALVPELPHRAAARGAFADQLRSLVNPMPDDPAEGPMEFFTESGTVVMERLAEPIPMTAPAAGGDPGPRNGHAVASADPTGGSLAAARNVLNYVTFYAMKNRSGVIGEQGLAPTIAKIKGERPAVRVHLVGHSFGARLVAAAARVAPPAGPADPIATVALLQAAFSHYGFSDDWDPNQPGAQTGYFRADITGNKVVGPILITYTVHDVPLGVPYALATRLAGHFAPSLAGDAGDTYGALGRNGAQRTPEVVAGQLLAVGGSYNWQPGRPHNLLGDAFIADHSAVTGREIAYALLSAIATT
ncbi:MAG TPA: hypothetical protein VGM60_11590 [Pseudonocardia sp.]|jgi:hypothetical protein|uniref:hypothetical protein n=1 Tax=Pseudonocardia sp. TaxID=60912 RepID=UPI002F41E98F